MSAIHFSEYCTVPVPVVPVGSRETNDRIPITYSYVPVPVIEYSYAYSYEVVRELDSGVWEPMRMDQLLEQIAVDVPRLQ
eukprot:COSAG02_NODE_5763_length_4059_cov_5.780808_1_plen_79_part_10